jgi:hypothetical protein
MHVGAGRESDRTMIVQSAEFAPVDRMRAGRGRIAVAADAAERLAQVLVMPVYFMGSRFSVGCPAWSVHCPR